MCLELQAHMKIMFFSSAVLLFIKFKYTVWVFKLFPHHIMKNAPHRSPPFRYLSPVENGAFLCKCSLPDKIAVRILLKSDSKEKELSIGLQMNIIFIPDKY